MRIFYSGIIAVICFVMISAGIAQGAQKVRAQSTIAVPRFLNVTADASVDWLVTGFAETLSTKLAAVGGLQLVERSRLTEAIKELKLQSTALVEPKTAKKLGLFVGAEYIIVGSFQKVGNTIKADARQIEVETGKVNGAVDVSGSFDRVLDLQSELAIKLIGILGRKISDSESEMLSKTETSSIPAYEWNAKGTQQTDIGDYDEAIVSFTRALQLDNSYAAAYYNRGLAQYGRNDLESAISDYTRAIGLDSTYYNAFNNRGVAYDDKRDYNQAIKDFDSALAIKPDSSNVLNNRANSYMKKGSYQRALQDYNAAIKVRPKDSLLYYNRGNLYLAMGKCDCAETDYSCALELNPAYEQAYNNRGSCRSRQGRSGQALADFKKAISLNRDYAMAYYNLALEQEVLGRKQEAVDAYRKFVKLADYNHSERIQKALAKIQKLERNR